MSTKLQVRNLQFKFYMEMATRRPSCLCKFVLYNFNPKLYQLQFFRVQRTIHIYSYIQTKLVLYKYPTTVLAPPLLITGAHWHSAVPIDGVGQVEGQQNENQLHNGDNSDCNNDPLSVRIDPVRNWVVASPVLVAVRVTWRVRTLPVHKHQILLILKLAAGRGNGRVLHRDPLVRLFKVFVAIHAAALHLRGIEMR